MKIQAFIQYIVIKLYFGIIKISFEQEGNKEREKGISYHNFYPFIFGPYENIIKQEISLQNNI